MATSSSVGVLRSTQVQGFTVFGYQPKQVIRYAILAIGAAAAAGAAHYYKRNWVVTVISGAVGLLATGAICNLAIKVKDAAIGLRDVCTNNAYVKRASQGTLPHDPAKNGAVRCFLAGASRGSDDDGIEFRFDVEHSSDEDSGQEEGRSVSIFPAGGGDPTLPGLPSRPSEIPTQGSFPEFATDNELTLRVDGPFLSKKKRAELAKREELAAIPTGKK